MTSSLVTDRVEKTFSVASVHRDSTIGPQNSFHMSGKV